MTASAEESRRRILDPQLFVGDGRTSRELAAHVVVCACGHASTKHGASSPHACLVHACACDAFDLDAPRFRTT